MALEDLVRSMAEGGQLVHLEHIAARSARPGYLATPLPTLLAERLPELWSHQAAAIDHARAGRSVAVATGTASGKSLCYQAPIAAAILGEGGGTCEGGGVGLGGGRPGEATSLLIFPTKALAQDQLRALGALDVPGLVATTYDGDTDPAARAWARRHANVVLTNPDMVHLGILPNHGRWATFLMRLRYVVLDELHTLRGIFGSHVAHVVRRLRRLCAFYGSSPTFVFCSATVGQPGRLASAICGLDTVEVDDDGSPQGERLFALWNPPLLDERSGARGSSNVEAARLLAGLVGAGQRSIVFSRSRKGAELVAAHTRSALPDHLATAVRPYRGGYLPRERREIEAELFDGRLLGVSATTALELGIDVGGLDACILNGFPGTIASMWQQAGRAGRHQQQSLAVLVAGPDALDQWLMAHPSDVFSRVPEPAVVNPSNPFVLGPHLACAAYELPLVPDDEQYWGGADPSRDGDAPDEGNAADLDEGVRRLVVEDVLGVRNGRAVYTGRGRPAHSVGLRSGGSTSEYRIVDSEGELIGTVDQNRAFQAVHPGAVYLHQGQHYRVEDLDVDDRAAWVVAVDPSELTQARSSTQVMILTEDRSTTVGRARLSLGSVEVTEQVTGYRRTSLPGGEVLGDTDLELPATCLSTRAFWYTVEPVVLARARLVSRLPATPSGRGEPGGGRVPGTLHGAEHAAIGILPLFTICDRWDVGGVSTAVQAETGLPTIVIYDGFPGGAGIAELGFAAGRSHLEATLEVIASCPCETGCPSCVQSPKCGNLNEPLDKAGAVALLRAVLIA